MKKEIKIEELDGMELLKLIYDEINTKFNYLEEKINTKFNYLEEKIDTKFNYLDEKIDTKFNYLDEKIDNTQNTLVREIAEELKIISEVSSEKINNLEKKLDKEIEDRKLDVSRVKEFNRIILNDIRGRVSILEEEKEKYNLN